MPGRSFVSGQKTKENFTGHELDDESGIVYAGARYYKPGVGRWTSVDPLAELYSGHSPYNYVLNNPVGMVDPDGRAPTACPSCEIRINNRGKRYFSGEITREHYVTETTIDMNRVVGATGEFMRNYRDMREANTIGADKYYHCNANYEATQRGEEGTATAKLLSDLRELFDRFIKGDPEEASEADQEANRHGRKNADSGTCDDVCEEFRPDSPDSNRTREVQPDN